MSFKQLKKSAITTSTEFFQNLLSEVELAIENLKKLNEFITLKCGGDSPSFHGVLNLLEDVKRITSKNMENRKKEEKEQTTMHSTTSGKVHGKDEGDEGDEEEQKGSLSQNNPNQGNTIEQAYSVMVEIANFLEIEQPQSPASTLVRIAVAIGKKNFQELLEINMKSGASVINTISELYRVLHQENNNQS
jgi:hypothetical protein